MDSMWTLNMYTSLILLPEEQKLKNFLSEEMLMYLT